MYKIVATGSFKKDVKRCMKRGLNMDLLDEVILTLEKTGNLPAKYKPHVLVGNYKDCWECHIKPDWLLIWKQEEVIQLISLLNTGTHSDLF